MPDVYRGSARWDDHRFLANSQVLRLILFKVENPQMSLARYAILLSIILPIEANAARCKVDGQWYPYDSPQCRTQAGQTEAPAPEQPDQTDNKEEVLADPERSEPSVPSEELSWSAVADDVGRQCNGQPDDLRALECLLREESGFWAMMGNFAMPEAPAAESKHLCRTRSSSFSSQAECMHGESRGYFEFSKTYDMPQPELSTARSECVEEFAAFANRAPCLERAADRYKDRDKSIFQKDWDKRQVGPIYPRARAGTRAPPPGYSDRIAIVSFTAKPLTRAQASAHDKHSDHLMLNEIELAQIQHGAIELDGAFDENEPLYEYREVPVVKPPASEEPFFSYHMPISVHPERKVSFGGDATSKAYLELPVTRGTRYLLVFNVSASQPITYRVSADKQDQIIEDMGGTYRHILVELLAERSGVSHISIGSEFGKYFRLFSAQVVSRQATN
jgi:hypothetical protein